MKSKKEKAACATFLFGLPERIRTADTKRRRLVLYPAELRKDGSALWKTLWYFVISLEPPRLTLSKPSVCFLRHSSSESVFLCAMFCVSIEHALWKTSQYFVVKTNRSISFAPEFCVIPKESHAMLCGVEQNSSITAARLTLSKPSPCPCACASFCGFFRCAMFCVNIEHALWKIFA